MIVLMRLIRAVWRAVIFSETQKATRSSEFYVDMAQSLRLQPPPNLRVYYICHRLELHFTCGKITNLLSVSKIFDLIIINSIQRPENK